MALLDALDFSSNSRLQHISVDITDENVYVPVLRKLVDLSIEHIELPIFHAISPQDLKSLSLEWTTFDDLVAQIKVQKIGFHLIGLEYAFELHDQEMCRVYGPELESSDDEMVQNNSSELSEEVSERPSVFQPANRSREDHGKDMIRELKVLLPQFIAGPGGGMIYSSCGDYKYITLET